jgi:hypothetical protein
MGTTSEPAAADGLERAQAGTDVHEQSRVMGGRGQCVFAVPPAGVDSGRP